VTQSSPLFGRTRLSWRRHLGLAVSVAALALGACAQSDVRQAAKDATDGAPGEDALLTLAGRMVEEQRFAAAVPLYREAYRSGADDVGALAGLADALMSLGRYDEAERVLRPAMLGERTAAPIDLAMGEVQLAFGRPEIALEHFERAAGAGGGARAHSGRGIALDAQGRHADALEAHARAVRAGGGDPNLLSNQALSFALYDDAARGVEILEQVVEQSGAGPQHRQNLALAYVLAGDTEKAGRMASVDLDADSAADTIRYFREMAALEPAERVRAMIFAAKSPERTLSDVGVLRFAEDDQRDAAAARLLRSPAPKPAPEPEPEPEPAPAPEPEPEPEPAPEPEPEPEPAKLPPLVEPEGWSVQLAAFRTAERLIRARELYWERYGEVLGPLPPRRSEVDFGERETPPRGFFYRLNAGPLKDMAQAREICERLKQDGADCWIRPPEPSEGRLPSDSPSSD